MPAPVFGHDDPGQAAALAPGVLPAAAVGLLLLLQSGPAQAEGRTAERVGATLLGVAIAYVFGPWRPARRSRPRTERG
ncbi:hypothetical protein [Streptomyces sp. NRRL B-24484]|uniref:hypothetical protein n=1 Tax=Streptomyces sp. NRRL B-24484 TaxID=1463833 RepID=UPI0004C18B85|nr:hypothetical protein [Streptomyces sp. NRRL B-24484]